MSHSKSCAGIERVIRPARQAKPQHIHRRLRRLGLELGETTQASEAPVRTNSELCSNGMPAAVSGTVPDTPDCSACLNQFLDVGSHVELEMWKTLGLGCDEIQEVDLRNEGDMRVI